jgi:hypothetical protein
VKIAVESDPLRLAACPECNGCGTTVDRALISAAPALLAACEAAETFADFVKQTICNVKGKWAREVEDQALRAEQTARAALAQARAKGTRGSP